MRRELERLVRPEDRVGEPAPAWTHPFCMACGRHHAPAARARRPLWRRLTG